MRTRNVILLRAALALSVFAAPGCILETARRDGTRCSEANTCPPGQQCSGDGQCLYPCPKACSLDNECGCGGIDRGGDKQTAGGGWSCLSDGLCHFKCGGEIGMGAGTCWGYMNCDTSSGVALCLPACTDGSQCANGATCVTGSGSTGGSKPPNFCRGTGSVGDGSVGDGGVGDGGAPDGGPPGSFRLDLYPTSTEPRALAAGQISTDSLLDLVVVSFSSDNAYVLLGEGDGTLSQMGQFVMGDMPYWVGLGRFDMDASLDFVFLYWNDRRPDVRMGDGAGNLQHVWQASELPFRPTAAVVARLNGDSFDDLAAISQSDNQLVVALTDTMGQVVPGTPMGLPPKPNGLAAADLDGDGLDDLLIVFEGDGGLHSYLSNGDGTFTGGDELVPISAYTPVAVAAGKLDDDPQVDVVVLMQPGTPDDAFKVLFNFIAPTAYTVGIPNSGGSYVTIFLGDFDGDGRTDIGALNKLVDGTGEVVMFRNRGGGVFDSGEHYGLGAGPVGAPLAAVAGRFNADECDDVAVVLPQQNKTAVLVSTGCAPGQ
ncbi:MAG: VCBS repeat-containing protein [Deltaproteobacteria bacterium]|nr:VCBS repeat-containing protein [Deltaproteobacteria bacterium]